MGRAVSGILVIIILLLVVGCGSGGISPSEELVPEGANLMARLQLSEVLQDEGIAELYESISDKEQDQPATFQGLLDMAQKEVGVDLREFSQITLFADTSREQFFGVIAKGTFDQDALLQGIEKSAKAQFFTTDYKGHELHFATEETGDEIAVVFLDEETAVFGVPEVVRQVVDVLEGDRESVRGRILDRYNSLGASWLKVAFEIPPAAFAEIPESTAAPINLQFVKDIQVIGVSGDKAGEDIDIQLTADFATETSATSAGDAIDGALKLVSTFVPDEKLRDLLSGVEVATKESTVTVSFKTSATQLREIIKEPPEFDFGDIFNFGDMFGRTETLPARERVPHGGPIETVRIQGREHVQPGESHPPYISVPPTSGWHYPFTASWGIHSSQIQDAAQVHNLEHGGVFIQYDTEDTELIAQMQAIAERQSGFPCYLIVAPYEGLDQPIALTAWGVLQRLGSYDERAIQEFINAYRAHGPERVPCTP